MTRLEDGGKVATGPLSVSYRPPHFVWCAQDVNGSIVHIREQPHECEAINIVIFIHTERVDVARQVYIHDQRDDPRGGHQNRSTDRVLIFRYFGYRNDS